MITLIRCTCCQAELTAPQFYNGLPYGFTCIKKVDPAFKRTKIIYTAVEAFKVVSTMGTRNVVNVKHNGKWQQIVVYGDITARTTSSFQQDGILYVAEEKLS